MGSVWKWRGPTVGISLLNELLPTCVFHEFGVFASINAPLVSSDSCLVGGLRLLLYRLTGRF